MESTNYILLHDPRQEDIITAVQQLTDLYADSGFTNGITLYKSTAKEELYILFFSNQPDFERFKYFVNYLTYPEIDNFKAKVFGYWTVTAADNLPQRYIGQRALVYVSEQDTEGDNVHAVFKEYESTIKMGFASGEEFQVLGEKEFSFSEPHLEQKDLSLIRTFTPNISLKKTTKPGCSIMMATFMAFGILLMWIIK
ncbi:hypothetical protein [uncultured Pontibacter sp.]|uniref:hypothetical protein n=1 Tax=uncultured Pontibacter sp. TaxID=453356 RepID=UPI002613AC8A|nr:hypothetical protein [uncultured Pontibacter sp.]